MATIHSLPTELIRHILSLAYPFGQWPDPSPSGLSRTGLVHSSWTGPSLSVLFDKIELGPRTASRFAESGPVGWSCGELSFYECASGLVRAVLTKAKAGGIRNLKIRITKEKLNERVFEYASLKGERCVDGRFRDADC